jgi:hypothetical protein
MIAVTRVPSAVLLPTPALGLGFRVQGAGCRVQGAEFRV